VEQIIRALAAELVNRLEQLERDSNINSLVLQGDDELRSEAILICQELNSLKEKLSALMQ